MISAPEKREEKSVTGVIRRMYPKVKVRVQDWVDQDDDISLGWSGMSSPGEYQADSPKCVIRVPTAQIPKHELLQPSQEPKDEKERKSEEPVRFSTRSSSALRPRAVLSSPENDEIIGNENSNRVIQPSPLRNHSMVQNCHAQCKMIDIQTMTKSPIITRRKPKAAVRETPTTEKLHSTKGKPKPVEDQTPLKGNNQVL